MWINESAEYRANKASDAILEYLKRDWPGLKIYTAQDGSFQRLAAHLAEVETVTLTRQAQRPSFDQDGNPVLDQDGNPVLETYEQSYPAQVSTNNTHEMDLVTPQVVLKNSGGAVVDTIPLTLVYQP